MPELLFVGDHEEIQRFGFLRESGCSEKKLNRCEGVSKMSDTNKISPQMLSSLREFGRELNHWRKKLLRCRHFGSLGQLLQEFMQPEEDVALYEYPKRY